MNSPTPPATDWSPCPRGLLQNHAARQRRRARQQQLLQLGTVLSVFIISLVGGRLGVIAMRPECSFDYGGITCSEVRKLVPEFITGTLLPELANKFDLHLAECTNCQEFLQERMGSNSAANSQHWQPLQKQARGQPEWRSAMNTVLAAAH